MTGRVQVCTVTEQAIASVRVCTTFQDLSDAMRSLLAEGEVYGFLDRAGIGRRGLNVILYRAEGGDAEAEVKALEIEVGVQVAAPFEGEGRVACSATPAGRVATAVHVGAYEALGETHAAIWAWCRVQARPISRLYWEVYGHWHEEPSQRRTDVYYLL